jgi:hypothetical protein
MAGRRRDLPPDLGDTVARARQVELAPVTTDQRLRAVRACGRLMLAYVQAEWRVAEVARAAGIDARAVHWRAAVARQRDAPVTGLAVPPPPERGWRPTTELPGD